MNIRELWDTVVLRDILGYTVPGAVILFALGLLAMGLFWTGWFVWGFFILMFGGLRHPPPLNDITPLDTKRKVLAVGSFVLLFLLGTPRRFG